MGRVKEQIADVSELAPEVLDGLTTAERRLCRRLLAAPATDPALYFRMRLIRTLETSLLEMFARNELFGTTHTCIGQEANAVGVITALDVERDIVWSNHRCHGHFLAYGGPIERLLAEIMGRVSGVCGGRRGSQHLCWRNFYSNGIQGGIAPLAVGCALAARDQGAVVTVFLGDGTMGDGAVYEALNMASLWRLPVLFVVEDNGIAQTTPRQLAVSGRITERARPFGIPCHHHAGTQVRAIHDLAAALVGEIRTGGGPAWLHLETVRLAPHSKGDDTRSETELMRLRPLDPLEQCGEDAFDRQGIDGLCQSIVNRAAALARMAPMADGSLRSSTTRCAA